MYVAAPDGENMRPGYMSRSVRDQGKEEWHAHASPGCVSQSHARETQAGMF